MTIHIETLPENLSATTLKFAESIPIHFVGNPGRSKPRGRMIDLCVISRASNGV